MSNPNQKQPSVMSRIVTTFFIVIGGLAGPAFIRECKSSARTKDYERRVEEARSRESELRQEEQEKKQSLSALEQIVCEYLDTKRNALRIQDSVDNMVGDAATPVRDAMRVFEGRELVDMEKDLMLGDASENWVIASYRGDLSVESPFAWGEAWWKEFKSVKISSISYVVAGIRTMEIGASDNAEVQVEGDSKFIKVEAKKIDDSSLVLFRRHDEKFGFIAILEQDDGDFALSEKSDSFHYAKIYTLDRGKLWVDRIIKSK